MEDFTCPACGSGLPGFPERTDQAAYCSTYCRDGAESEADTDQEDDDAGPPPAHIVGPAAWNRHDGWFAIDKVPF